MTERTSIETRVRFLRPLQQDPWSASSLRVKKRSAQQMLPVLLPSLLQLKNWLLRLTILKLERPALILELLPQPLENGKHWAISALFGTEGFGAAEAAEGEWEIALSALLGAADTSPVALQYIRPSKFL